MAMVVALAVALTCLFSVIPHAEAQFPGWLHIACGAAVSFTDSAGIDWVTDEAYISTGEVGNTANTTYWPGWLELVYNRYFPSSRAKNCFTLPVTPQETYMLRVEFMFGDYTTTRTPPFSFQIAQDSTIVENVTIPSNYFDAIREFTFAATSNTTTLCLMRDASNATPFINSISLRPVANLPPTILGWLAQNQCVSTMARLFFYNGGGLNVLYYNEKGDRSLSDVYDRYWWGSNGSQGNAYPLSKASVVTSTAPLQFLSVNNTIDTNSSANANLVNNIPEFVLQWAMTTTGNLTIPLNATAPFNAYIQYYFVELDSTCNATDRSFFIDSPGASGTYNNNVVNYTGGPLRLWVVHHDKAFIQPGSNVVMYPDPARTSSRGPMISGMEVFKVDIPWTLPTNGLDYAAIEFVKSGMELTSWGGDPCLPYPHEWVTCNLFNGTTDAAVIAIVLSGYGLNGSISPAFNQLLSLTSLKLDNNSLTGPIPDLSALKNLKTLDLQNNKLSGPLPDWLASLPLQELFVQNNDFSQNIPAAFLTKNWNFNYSGNPSLTLAPPSPKTNIAPVIGGVVGGLLLLAVIIGLIFFFRCRGKRDVDDSMAESLTHSSQPAKPGGAREFSLAEVDVATDHEKKIIGKGGFGKVYYGKLPDRTEVAVKVLDKTSKQGTLEFFNEVDILSRVHHRHLVSLVGFCRSQQKQMLIYEYIHKGSLREHLDRDTSKTGAVVMDWKTRLNVALQAALGLEYLHTGCSPSFIHRDVKSNNILITSRNEAKVADFGLSRLVGEDESTQMMTTVKGTLGYLDPEYYNTQCLSAKSDVYSFGVVLLELITGRMPICIDPKETNPNLCEWVRARLVRGNIDVILDPELRAFSPDHDALWKVAEIALRSVKPTSMHRPTMNDVVQELQSAVQLEGRDSGHYPKMALPGYAHMSSGSYSDHSNPQLASDISNPR